MELSSDNNTQLEWSYFGKEIIHVRKRSNYLRTVDGFLNKIVKRLRGMELSTDNNTQLEWNYFGKEIIHVRKTVKVRV